MSVTYWYGTNHKHTYHGLIVVSFTPVSLGSVFICFTPHPLTPYLTSHPLYPYLTLTTTPYPIFPPSPLTITLYPTPHLLSLTPTLTSHPLPAPLTPPSPPPLTPSSPLHLLSSPFILPLTLTSYPIPPPLTNAQHSFFNHAAKKWNEIDYNIPILPSLQLFTLCFS